MASGGPGLSRAHVDHGELCYSCIIRLRLPLATFSDHVHYETHTDEDEEDDAYNLGREESANTHRERMKSPVEEQKGSHSPEKKQTAVVNGASALVG